MAKTKHSNTKHTLSAQENTSPTPNNSLSSLAITATLLGALIGQSNDQLSTGSINLYNILNDISNSVQTELVMPEETERSNDDLTSLTYGGDIPLGQCADKGAIIDLETLLPKHKYSVISEYDKIKEQEKLENKHQYLALVSAAREFGNLIPRNFQDLQEKVQHSLIAIGEESKSDGAALERIILFCGDLTNDLRMIYNQNEESEPVVLSGALFNVRLLTAALNVQVKGVRELVDEILLNEVGTLMAIFQTLFALYELIKNVKTDKNKRIHPKTIKELNSVQQTLRDSGGLNLWVLESATDRLRKLIIEFSKMIEDCSDPEKEYRKIYEGYRKKICTFINEIRKTNANNLPDVREIIQAWKEFGCEA